MASAAEIRAENERIAKEIHELLTRNTTLQREMMQLNTERDLLAARGQDKVTALASELEEIREQVTALRSQCESMVEVISGRSDRDNEVDDDEDFVPPPPPPTSRQRKLSTAINQTFMRARGMSMPRPRRPSAVTNIAKGLNKAASYVKAATPSPEPRRTPMLHKNSPQILSYAKGTTDAKKSLLVATHSHYGNFRRHSGPYRKNKETMVL